MPATEEGALERRLAMHLPAIGGTHRHVPSRCCNPAPTCCECWKERAQRAASGPPPAASTTVGPPRLPALAATCAGSTELKDVMRDSCPPPKVAAVGLASPAEASGCCLAAGCRAGPPSPALAAAAAAGAAAAARPPKLAPAKRDSWRAVRGGHGLGDVAAEVAAEVAVLAADSRLLKRASCPLEPPPAPAAEGLLGWLALSARDMCCASLCAALPAGPTLSMRLSRPVMAAAPQHKRRLYQTGFETCSLSLRRAAKLAFRKTSPSTQPAYPVPG